MALYSFTSLQDGELLDYVHTFFIGRFVSFVSCSLNTVDNKLFLYLDSTEGEKSVPITCQRFRDYPGKATIVIILGTVIPMAVILYLSCVAMMIGIWQCRRRKYQDEDRFVVTVQCNYYLLKPE